MKHNKHTPSRIPKPAAARSQGRWAGAGRWVILAVLIGGGAVAGVLSMTLPGKPRHDENSLIGRWQRPDGGYVIDIRGAKADGQLEAAYFNPNAIHIARAEWRKEDSGLSVFVELRDTNYPGATYKLNYLPEKDLLAGEYFQPLAQQTFEVYFARMAESKEPN